MKYAITWPQFFTASIYNRAHILKDDEYKDIIIDCLKFLVSNNRIEVNAFVIMSNHVHIIWQPLRNQTITQVQTSFMTYTAKTIKKKLLLETPDLLKKFKVNKYDRTYQVWKREPLNIELFTEKVFLQKLEYIHYNPVVARLVHLHEQYHYSSAKFYELGSDNFSILTHYSGN